MDRLAARLAEVRERIATAARKSGRAAADVRLVAVSKTRSVEAIRTLHALGQNDFAENQIQEGMDKIEQFAGQGLHWHFIGHLQSNKSRFIPGNFGWVHSVDSEKLARRIAQAAEDNRHPVKLLLQVNVSNDPAKHGVRSEALFPLIESILEHESSVIQLRGLMTLGYRLAAQDETRRMFAELRQLLEQCRRRFGDALCELSMGMSADYELAIEEGATMVRLGTTLFGERT